MAFRNPRITPWRSPDDLVVVKNSFFPAPGLPDTRPAAVSTVHVWLTRGAVPHSIEATLLLTETQLHDVPGVPETVLCLAYSTAICRFVNGLLDPLQDKKFAQSMFQLAHELDLPAMFIDVRHDCTHANLPSLRVLRVVAYRALQWLWDNYWTTITVGDEVNDTAEGRDALRARALLKEWRHLRRDNHMREIKAGDQSAEAKEARRIIKETVSLCSGEDGNTALVTALLEVKGLIPAGKKKLLAVPGAVHLWAPLLKAVDHAVPMFIEALIDGIEVFWRGAYVIPLARLKAESVVSRLAASGRKEAGAGTEQDVCEVLVAWLKHLTSEKFWGMGSTVPVDVEGLAGRLISNPNRWSLDAFKFLLQENATLRKRFQPLLELAELQAVPMAKEEAGKRWKTSDNDQKRKLDDINADLTAYEDKLFLLEQCWQAKTAPGVLGKVHVVEKVEKAGKWRRPKGPWKPRPFGII